MLTKIANEPAKSLSENSRVDRDASAIASLLTEAFAEYQSLYTPKGYEATVIANQQVMARIKEGPVWIAILDGLVVGTVSVVPKGESLYIRGMAVLLSLWERLGEGHRSEMEAASSFGIRNPCT